MAIATLPDGPEKNNLYTLEADLKELIILSKNSKLESVESNKSKDDPLFEEYNLFKVFTRFLLDII